MKDGFKSITIAIKKDSAQLVPDYEQKNIFHTRKGDIKFDCQIASWGGGLETRGMKFFNSSGIL